MQVAISGASGFVGSALTAALRADGHRVRRVVRPTSDDPDDPDDPDEAGSIRWDPTQDTIDAAALEGLDAVVHLAGASIGERRWSPEHKRAMLESRTGGTRLLATTLAELERPPKVLLSASAIGYYGDRGDEVLTETSSPGEGFFAEVVAAWEEAAGPARAAGIRTVFARSGIVLNRRGGALRRMLRPFQLGLGGPLGSGSQWMSWISLADQIGALRFLLDHDGIDGPVNLVAPNPVSNRDFAKALGRTLRRPAVLPVPRFALRLLLGREMADELLFVSQRVEPQVLSQAGFEFAHATIDGGLQAAMADR
jgi:uncharacterized protein (TIGR01777 family)